MKNLILILLILTSIHQTKATGFIIIEKDNQTRLNTPNYLSVKSIQINASLKENIATTNIDEVFYNNSTARLEGYFVFPVPEGATIKNFSMFINGKEMPAELLDAPKAKKIYEDIVRKMKDPALLEYANQSLFRVRIYPIEPKSEKRIKISYDQVLTKNNGTFKYILPFKTARHSANKITSIGIKLILKTVNDIKSIYCPTHNVEVNRLDKLNATIGFEASNYISKSDFELFFSTTASKVGASLIARKRTGEDGFFMLNISPGYVKKENILPKDITFVLDASGSMAGEKMEQAKKSLLFCVNNLNTADRFQIIRFSTEANALFTSLSKADNTNIAKAKNYINDLRAMGGTNIEEALTLALNESEKEGRPHIIVFMTDGKPTIGLTNTKQLLAKVKGANKKHTRIFTFGIGTEINTHLLDKITAASKGYRSYILPDEDIELKISDFYQKVSSPVLTDLKLEFDPSVQVMKVYPKVLSDLFSGSSITVLGRYKTGKKSTLKLKGKVNGKEESFSYSLEFKTTEEGNDFIPKIWATRSVGYLLDQIRLNGQQAELVEEVTRLAKKYGIVTPYTSYLILEDQAQQANNNITRRDELLLPPVRMHNPAMLRKSKSSYKSMSDFGGTTGVRSSKKLSEMKYQISAEPEMEEVEQDKSTIQYTLSKNKKTANGRAFYKVGDYWIDPLLQKQRNKHFIKIQFGTAAYFELLKMKGGIEKILALGSAVKFVWKGKVYKIYM